MATLNPSQLPSLREDGGLFRELDVLERLRLGLPDGFEIFHEVTWHTIHEGSDKHGEIDIVVLSPSDNVCEFRSKLDTHSTANWTAIPEQTGH